MLTGREAASIDYASTGPAIFRQSIPRNLLCARLHGAGEYDVPLS